MRTILPSSFMREVCLATCDIRSQSSKLHTRPIQVRFPTYYTDFERQNSFEHFPYMIFVIILYRQLFQLIVSGVIQVYKHFVMGRNERSFSHCKPVPYVVRSIKTTLPFTAHPELLLAVNIIVATTSNFFYYTSRFLANKHLSTTKRKQIPLSFNY